MSRVGTLARAWRLRRASPEARAAHRARRRADLVAFARARSPFYAERYAGLPERVDDPRLLPPVTKRELMERFDDWVTDPALRREAVSAFLDDPDRVGERLAGCLVVQTSGSTGGRGFFVHDARAAATYSTLWARGLRRWIGGRELLRFARRGLRTARVMSIGGHFPSHSYSSFEARGRLRRPQCVVSIMDPIPRQAAALEAFDPTVIAGYPTGLVLLARERVAGRLAVEPIFLVSVTESLESAMRSEIEAAFGAPVRNVYSASEHFGIAFDCREGRLHLNDDALDFEPVDDDLEPVPAGETSTGVLITNLENRVQPLIRYLLTDAVRADPEPCPCGSRLPAIDVFSKRRQILSFEGADGRRVDVLPVALMEVPEAIQGVDAYQIVHARDGALRARLATVPGVDPDAVWAEFEDGVSGFLEAQGATAVRIVRDPEPPRRDPVSGKYHKIWTEAAEGGIGE